MTFPAFGGAYTSAGEALGEDLVKHPIGYTGAGGELTLTLCIDPAFPNAAAAEISIQNIATTFNQLTPTTGNLLFGDDNDIPSGSVDFESTALHEVGHCIGLAHANAASESGLPSSEWNYTKATNGANNAFDLDPGNDGLRGSGDDVRGDDGNLHWFEIGVNNPFVMPSVVDSSTYSRDPANLPGGETFAANGDRDVSVTFGVPDTEAVMQQGAFFDEDQRRLTADDVATLLYARTGIDEVAGTADDYTVNLVYIGQTTNCDLRMAFDDQAGFAFCSTGSTPLGGNHQAITTAFMSFNSGFDWFFSDILIEPDEIFTDGFESGDVSAWSP